MTSGRIESSSSSCTAVRRVALVAAGLALLVVASAHADGTPYRIGPGDVLDVQVWREADLSGEHRIDAEGRLHHVLAGAVPAAGLTCEELAAELSRWLERDYLREARVVVALETSARRKAWILGAVSRPGHYPVGEATRLLDLVFAGGGPTPEAEGRATLYRMGEPQDGDTEPALGQREPLEEIPVDLGALLGGDLAQNRAVGAGDVLVVAGASAPGTRLSEPSRIRIVGEVARPGSYALVEAPTALDAVLAAGGLTEYAASNRARLVRGEGEGRSVRKLRLGDIVGGQEDSENVALEGGDLIVVPESFF